MKATTQNYTKKTTTKEKDPPKLNPRQSKFLEYGVKTLGNVTAAIFAFNQRHPKNKLHRRSHYFWYDNDPEYRKAWDELKEVQVDFYEEALRKTAMDGSAQASIFALRAKGRKRGWIDKQHIEHSGSVSDPLSAEEVKEQIKRLLKKK